MAGSSCWCGCWTRLIRSTACTHALPLETAHAITRRYCYAIGTHWWLTQYTQNTLLVTQAGGVRKLVALLASGAAYLRPAALLTLRNCIDALPECITELVSAADNDAAVLAVVRMLRVTDNVDVQAGTCMLLEALVRGRRDAIVDIIVAHGVLSLLQVVICR